jgi:PAS domain S-box-containing protein
VAEEDHRVSLAETEAAYRSLFENMEEGLSRQRMIFEDGVAVDYVFLDNNAAFERITGFHDVVGKHVLDFLPGLRESDPHLFEVYGRVAAGGPQETFESYVAAMDRWFSISVYCPVQGEFVTIFTEITARKRAEQALREANELYERTQAIAETGSWRMDLATKMFTLSNEAARLLGVEPGRPISATEFWSKIHAEDRGGIMAPGNGEGSRHAPAEARVLLPDGETRWLRLMGRAEVDPNGRPVAHVGFIRDVTARRLATEALEATIAERERAQAELARSEEFYRELLEKSPIAIGVMRQGQGLFANEAHMRMFRYSDPAELTTLGPDDMTAPEDREAAHERIRLRQLGKPVSDEYEFTALRRDGTTFPVHVKAASIELHDGPATLLFHTDLTEIRKASEALRASEALHRAVLEQAPIPIAAHRDGQPIFANTAHRRMFGYEDEEAIAPSLIEMVAPEDREEVLGKIAARGPGETVEYEFTGYRRNGERFPASVRAAPVELPGGPGTLVFHADLTEIKRATEELRASEERFASVFRMAPVILAIVDLQADRYIDINDEAERVFGYKREEFIDKTTGEVVELLKGDESAIRMFAEDGSPDGVEVHRVTKDGREIVLLARGERTVLNGRECLVTMSLDVTEQRKAEAERARLVADLAQAQKMEAVGQLAGGIAHDFNNLLTAIGGFAQILEMGMADGSATVDDATQIRLAADRARALTSRLLAFSGRHASQPEMIDVGKIVDQILPMLRRLVPERIELVGEAGPCPSVLGDASEIDQLILNLVVNGGDAIAGQGRILVSTSSVDHDAAYVRSHVGAISGPHARLAVSDTGAGMDESTQGRIFEPFFTTKPGGQGTGLGLATVYGIVERMHGTIEVTSVPGKGSTFEIHIPAAVVPSQVAEPVADRTVSEGHERVLIVEDEDLVRQFTSSALSRLGYEVVVAESGAAALKVDPASYDVVVTDVVMPKMSGVDLAALLRSQRPDLPIVFVSGYAHDSIGKLPLEEDRNLLVDKPFTLTTLSDAIRRVRGQA